MKDRKSNGEKSWNQKRQYRDLADTILPLFYIKQNAGVVPGFFNIF